MDKVIQRGILLLVVTVPLIFSQATTEVYGLSKVAVLEVGVLLLLGLWLFKLANSSPNKNKADSPIAVGRIGWAVLAFFAAAILSLLAAVNIPEAIKTIYQLAAGVGLFFVIINNIREGKQVNQLILAMVLAGLLACFFSLYENQGIRLGVLRFAYTSTFGNPIFFAQYLSLVIPISLILCLQKNSSASPTWRLFFGLSTLLMLLFLGLTRSRGAYLGLFLAAVYFYIIIRLYSSPRVKKLLKISGLVVVVVAFSLGVVFSTQLKSWLGENIRFRNFIRVHLWSSTVQMAKDNPVLGVGVGNSKVVYPLYRSHQEKGVIPKGVGYSKAHNDFLQVWAEMGTLGLICFLGIIFAILPLILRPLAKRDGPAAPMSLGLALAMIALLTQAFFNPLLYVPSSGMGFWVLLGLIALSGKEKTI